MRETTIFGDKLIYRDDDGEADVRLYARERPGFGTLLIETINTGESNRLFIADPHRAAVALALLGGITDELVERCAQADYEAMMGDHWGDAKERLRVDARCHARVILEAVFGAAIGGGGEGEG